MDQQMFCYQCEQTVGGRGCTASRGACGKSAATSNLQDALTQALIDLALRRANSRDSACDQLMLEGLFITITNVSFDDDAIRAKIREVVAACGQGAVVADETNALAWLWNEPNEDIRSLKSLILLGLRGMGAYAYHALMLGQQDESVNAYFYEALALIKESRDADALLKAVLKVGEVNLACMRLLDAANTGAYGHPVPTQVPLSIEKGPFIVVSGHDLKDLELLLEQTRGRGVNIYTHGEMLPAHGYPTLKAYPHLKGNFGTAWQNQQKEFDALPGAVLFTTNCLMPPMASYADRAFTTAVVAYPGLVHIGEDKDFTPVIEKALALGGYAQAQPGYGINGGQTVMTGFGHNAVLGQAQQVIDAIKAGAVKHVFLVGGCDGAKPGRNYYTDFVSQTPKDSLVLTLACGKYRFNDLDLGRIGPFPRLMDMGQCNDAYSAIRVATALAGAFHCGVNDLPLSIVLSWYEQKAVCVLLSLLHLGIRNIRLGPSLPAFVSPGVLNVLVDTFGIAPITTPQEDLQTLLAAKQTA